MATVTTLQPPARSLASGDALVLEGVSRLFGALREEGISVILISQGSSEHSICCAVPQPQAPRAADVLRKAFAHALGQLQRRIQLFTSLPIDKLDAISLQKHLTEIGSAQ